MHYTVECKIFSAGFLTITLSAEITARFPIHTDSVVSECLFKDHVHYFFSTAMRQCTRVLNTSTCALECKGVFASACVMMVGEGSYFMNGNHVH